MVGVVVLLIAHLASQIYYIGGNSDPFEFHLTFNVDDEPSAPTWYSVCMLFSSSLLLLAIAGAKKRERDRDAPYWYGLSVGFAVLSLDEIAGLHETFNTMMDIGWTIPGAVLALATAILYSRFLLRLPARTRIRFLLAGAVFLGGAIVVEYLSGPPYFMHSLESIEYAYMTALEEGLEMTGAALFIAALLDYMMRSTGAKDVSVEIERRAP
jgi:hypothetical protein